MSILLFFVILFSFYSHRFKPVFWLSFTVGIFSDLLGENWLGVSSILFLVICFLVYLYRRKFRSNHLLFQLGFIFLTDCGWNLINNNPLLGRSNLFLILASLIIISFINKMKRDDLALKLEI